MGHFMAPPQFCQKAQSPLALTVRLILAKPMLDSAAAAVIESQHGKLLLQLVSTHEVFGAPNFFFVHAQVCAQKAVPVLTAELLVLLCVLPALGLLEVLAQHQLSCEALLSVECDGAVVDALDVLQGTLFLNFPRQ